MNELIILLIDLSMITSLVTEGFKKLLDDLEIRYIPNMLTTICGLVVGSCGTLIKAYLEYQPITAHTVVFAFVVGVLSAVGAMVGYDKVTQTLEQINKDK